MNKRIKELKEVHGTGYQLLKVIHHMDRNLIPESILQSLIEAILPYVGIIMSAQVIDQLLAKRFVHAIQVALVMIVVIFILGLLTDLLNQKVRVGRATLMDRMLVLTCKQALALDFESMENTNTQKTIDNTENIAHYNGGLGSLLNCYAGLLQYFLSIVIALVLVIELSFATIKNAQGWMKIIINPIVTLVIIFGTWVLAMFIDRKCANEIKEINNHIQDTHYIVEGQIGYWLEHVLKNVNVGKIIRVNNMKDTTNDHLTKWNREARKLFSGMGTVSRKQLIAEGQVNGTFSMVAYGVVLIKVLTNCISIGSFTKYAGALMQFNTATGKVVWMESEISGLSRNLKPFLKFLEQNNLMEKGTIHVEKRVDNQYEIEFHGVSFYYPNTKKEVLKGINCKLINKQKLAIVGCNGAGKTTFIKLLCRLYEPTEGIITLNGIDIRKYKYDEYLALFGVVFQDFHTFAASLGENIAMEKEFDQNKILCCLEQTGARDLPDSLEKGLDTPLDKGLKGGTNLSGGQLQKVAIARALYKNAPFVILDEPTASLDPISEAEIYEKFNQMVEDKTSIYISHRMSSCRFCDEILVFEDGMIKERGTHLQLLRNNQLYEKLWSAQAQYYVTKTGEAVAVDTH